MHEVDEVGNALKHLLEHLGIGFLVVGVMSDEENDEAVVYVFFSHGGEFSK